MVDPAAPHAISNIALDGPGWSAFMVENPALGYSYVFSSSIRDYGEWSVHPFKMSTPADTLPINCRLSHEPGAHQAGRQDSDLIPLGRDHSALHLCLGLALGLCSEDV